jgi:hypothetical protein
MSRKIKIAAVTAALSGLATTASAHVGDHSTAHADHFLVEHGFALGAVAFVIAAGTLAYIIKKKA